MRDGDIFKIGDGDRMPYGKYKGRAMEDVPASYLIWLFDNNKASPAVADYITYNMDVLRKEVKEKKEHGKLNILRPHPG